MAVGVGGQGRHLADQPHDLLAPDLGVVHVARFRIEGGKRRHGADQNAHRVSVVMESLHELLHVLMGQRVRHDLLAPALQIPGARQFAVQAAGKRLPGRCSARRAVRWGSRDSAGCHVAIQIRDGAVACGGVHVGGVIGHQAEIVGACLDLAEVHGANRAMVDRQRVSLIRPVVDYVMVSLAMAQPPCGHSGAVRRLSCKRHSMASCPKYLQFEYS
jgi:hypothetical protein